MFAGEKETEEKETRNITLLAGVHRSLIDSLSGFPPVVVFASLDTDVAEKLKKEGQEAVVYLYESG